MLWTLTIGVSGQGGFKQSCLCEGTGGKAEGKEVDEEAAGALRPRGPGGEGRGLMGMRRTRSWLGNTTSQVRAGQKMSSAGLGETESSLAVRATHCGLQCPLSACVLNEKDVIN